MPSPRLAGSAFGLLSLLAVGGRAEAAPAFQLLGKGVQVYACGPTAGGFGWALTGPDAVLTEADGKTAGRHFAGPSWQATDGSLVTGEPLIASPAPEPGAVAWLVLHAKSHAGAGRFADIGLITRTQTVGGAAPAGGCDPAHAGAQVREPYSATYTFFPQAAPR